MKAIFNAGVEKGRVITRASGRRGTITYNPFGPKMLAGIYGENPPLKGATLSRCIQIGLRRRYDRKEDISDFNKRDARNEAINIERDIKLWANNADHRALEDARPDMPGELTDRQRDAWLPLVVIADLIGEGWGRTARQWAVELSAAVPVTPDVMVQVLRDAYRALTGPGLETEKRVKTTTLADARNALSDREYDDDLTSIQLAKRLSRFHIKPSKWYDAKVQVRGFTVRTQSGDWTPEWKDAIGRYRLDDKRDNDV
jgi:hypothetical protein